MDLNEIAVFTRVAQAITRDRMAHYGYTPERVKDAEEWPGHEASGCFFENGNWVCTDEDEKPNHPDRDELERTAEFVVWVLEHPTTTRVIPPGTGAPS